MNSLSRLLGNGSVVTRETADTGFFAYILYRIAVTAGVLIAAFRPVESHDLSWYRYILLYTPVTTGVSP